MKKSTIGVLIVSVLLIVGGICLFVGGLVSAGGMEAAKRVLKDHELDILDDLDIDLDDDDFYIDFNSGKLRIDMDF